jgi:hypothetical protein
VITSHNFWYVLHRPTPDDQWGIRGMHLKKNDAKKLADEMHDQGFIVVLGYGDVVFLANVY